MLTIKPGRCLAPCSSANTNLTRTTSPRLQLVIRGILWIVPKGRQHGISAFIERDQVGGRELVDEIVFQASLNGFPDVLTNGLVALGCGDVNSSPGLTRNVNAKPRSSLVHNRHLRSIPYTTTLAHIRKCVNVKMAEDGCSPATTRIDAHDFPQIHNPQIRGA